MILWLIECFKNQINLKYQQQQKIMVIKWQIIIIFIIFLINVKSWPNG